MSDRYGDATWRTKCYETQHDPQIVDFPGSSF